MISLLQNFVRTINKDVAFRLNREKNEWSKFESADQRFETHSFLNMSFDISWL